MKQLGSFDHWLIVVDAAGTKRSVFSGILDMLKKVLPPQAKRCRLCVFAGSEIQGLALTSTKICETFSHAKCLEVKLHGEAARTAGKSAGEWLLVSSVRGSSVQPDEVSADHVSVPHFVALSQKSEPRDKVGQQSWAKWCDGVGFLFGESIDICSRLIPDFEQHKHSICWTFWLHLYPICSAKKQFRMCEGLAIEFFNQDACFRMKELWSTCLLSRTMS